MQFISIVEIFLIVVCQIAFIINIVHFVVRRKEKVIKLWYFKQAGVARYIFRAWYITLFVFWVLSFFRVIDLRSFGLVFQCFFAYLNVYSIFVRARTVVSQNTIDSVEADEHKYQEILELYKAGKTDDAKRLARSSLTSPSEFKKAWRLIKEELGTRGLHPKI